MCSVNFRLGIAYSGASLTQIIDYQFSKDNKTTLAKGQSGSKILAQKFEYFYMLFKA